MAAVAEAVLGVQAESESVERKQQRIALHKKALLLGLGRTCASCEGLCERFDGLQMGATLVATFVMCAFRNASEHNPDGLTQLIDAQSCSNPQPGPL